jgi:uncharacterized protein (TIGR02217 family)
MHFDAVLDLGFDYGADGGLAWDTLVIGFPNGRSRRNQNRSRPLGEWQIGNRDIDAATLHSLQSFHHAMRGRAHSFLFHDWTDYRATEQTLILDGGDETQLIKAYGLTINGWIRDILKPNPETVVIEQNPGSGWVALEADADYELDASTGLVTWIMDPPDTGDAIRWSGDFWVPARFDRDLFTAQFLGAEERPGGRDAAYAVGGLAIVEEPDPEDPEP